LLGYNVDADTVRPGGQIAVTLYWQALAPMNENYAVFVHLVNPAGALSAQRDTFPGLGNFPTNQWKPGDTFADTYRVDIGETAYAPDEAQVRVGLYLPDGRRLAASSADSQPLGDGVTLETVRLVPRPGDLPNPVRVNFGNQVALLGYDLNTRVIRPGETFSMTVYWQALGTMEVDYSEFMQVTNASDNIIAQNDGLPLTHPKRTRFWPLGQVLQEERPLTISPDAPAGLYDIEMGVYRRGLKGGRLPIIAPDGHHVSEQLTLVQVRVADK